MTDAGQHTGFALLIEWANEQDHSIHAGTHLPLILRLPPVAIKLGPAGSKLRAILSIRQGARR